MVEKKDFEQKDIIREKVDYFLKNKIKIHITRSNKEFINGMLIEKCGEEDIYLLLDEYGKQQKIFIIEIFKVDEWKPR